MDSNEEKKEVITPVIEAAAPQNPAPKKKKGVAGKIVLLAICCTLVGGVAGAAGMAAYYNLSGANKQGRDRAKFEQMMKDGTFDPENLPEDFDFRTRPGSKNNDQDSQANSGSNKTRKKPGQRKTDQDNSNKDGQAQGAQDKSEG